MDSRPFFNLYSSTRYDGLLLDVGRPAVETQNVPFHKSFKRQKILEKVRLLKLDAGKRKKIENILAEYNNRNHHTICNGFSGSNVN